MPSAQVPVLFRIVCSHCQAEMGTKTVVCDPSQYPPNPESHSLCPVCLPVFMPQPVDA